MALTAMAAGGALVVLSSGASGRGLGLGAVAVVFATVGWALDDTLSRPLADLSPTQVVRWNGALGAAFGLVLAVVLNSPSPS
jgi:drug/metabolite transporter (DMT)-like permease